VPARLLAFGSCPQHLAQTPAPTQSPLTRDQIPALSFWDCSPTIALIAALMLLGTIAFALLNAYRPRQFIEHDDTSASGPSSLLLLCLAITVFSLSRQQLNRRPPLPHASPCSMADSSLFARPRIVRGTDASAPSPSHRCSASMGYKTPQQPNRYRQAHAVRKQPRRASTNYISSFCYDGKTTHPSPVPMNSTHRPDGAATILAPHSAPPSPRFRCGKTAGAVLFSDGITTAVSMPRNVTTRSGVMLAFHHTVRVGSPTSNPRVPTSPSSPSMARKLRVQTRSLQRFSPPP